MLSKLLLFIHSLWLSINLSWQLRNCSYMCAMHITVHNYYTQNVTHRTVQEFPFFLPDWSWSTVYARHVEAPWLLTDNSNGLVMVIRNYNWLNSASRVLISTCSTPLATKHNFSLFDFDLWPTTLTYNPRLAKVKVDPHAKNQGQRSNGSIRRAPTVNQMDTHTDATKRIISLATRSTTIIVVHVLSVGEHNVFTIRHKPLNPVFTTALISNRL